jgi:bifunctional non-homologous end joining protein LigD
MIGAYKHGKLRHYGHAGSGFSEKGLKDAVDRMKPFFTDKSPFVNPPNIKEKIQWVRPKLGCEIEYTELTADDQLRRRRSWVGETTRSRGKLRSNCLD